MKKEDNSPTVADMEQLLQRIRSTYRLTDEQIAKAAGYNEGYIAQTRSRKQVPAKFMRALERQFIDAGKIDAVTDTAALLAVVVDRVSSLCADVTGRSASVERALIEKDAKELMKIRQA